MALPDTLTLLTRNYARLTDGRWIYESSTADEPEYIQIDSTVDQKSTSLVVKNLVYKNNALTGIDDLIQAHTVIRFPSGRATEAEVKQRLDILDALFDTTGYLTRILRGER